MTAVPIPESRERIAAVDVGSNSIRLLVAEYGPDSGLQVIDEVKEQPRLATGVARTRRLDVECDGPCRRGPQAHARRRVSAAE